MEQKALEGARLMRVLGIDPGTRESAWVLYESTSAEKPLLAYGWDLNEEVLNMLREAYQRGRLIGTSTLNAVEAPLRVGIEMIAHYGTGMSVGKEVFETCLWIGRFMEAVEGGSGRVCLVHKKWVCEHLCNDTRAKSKNINQALLDMLGPPWVTVEKIGPKGGVTKTRVPGPTNGMADHKWSALSIAVTLAQSDRDEVRQYREKMDREELDNGSS